MHEKFWKEIREDYNRLWRLCRTVDQHLSPLVIISFINNLFFICVQLYNSLKYEHQNHYIWLLCYRIDFRPRSGMAETVYFFYSFGFILARTIAVSLYAAWINDESRKPLEVLHSIPSGYYSTEVSRLTQQIYTCPIGLTGLNFFLITRSFLLRVSRWWKFLYNWNMKFQVAGTIVTFELMLLQFGPLLTDGQSSKYLANICVK